MRDRIASGAGGIARNEPILDPRQRCSISAVEARKSSWLTEISHPSPAPTSSLSTIGATALPRGIHPDGAVFGRAGAVRLAGFPTWGEQAPRSHDRRQKSRNWSRGLRRFAASSRRRGSDHALRLDHGDRAPSLPWSPVRLLLRHRFDSLGLAGSAETPVLVLMAERDTVVPHAHTLRLIDAWRGRAGRPRSG